MIGKQRFLFTSLTTEIQTHIQSRIPECHQQSHIFITKLQSDNRIDCLDVKFNRSRETRWVERDEDTSETGKHERKNCGSKRKVQGLC